MESQRDERDWSDLAGIALTGYSSKPFININLLKLQNQSTIRFPLFCKVGKRVMQSSGQLSRVSQLIKEDRIETHAVLVLESWVLRKRCCYLCLGYIYMCLGEYLCLLLKMISWSLNATMSCLSRTQNQTDFPELTWVLVVIIRACWSNNHIFSLLYFFYAAWIFSEIR